MNRIMTYLALVSAGIGIAAAEPLKCIVNGQAVYTDDPSRCANTDVKAVGGNVSVFPKVASSTKVRASSAPIALPQDASVPESLLDRFGLSGADLANGWKTIMEAKQRGSWKAPEMPDEAK